MKIAPIIVFVFNRPFHTLRTLEALSLNTLAKDSHLFIYSDGPSKDETSEQFSKILEVREVIRQKKWCKHVDIIESEYNKGLADSIINGVTEIVNKYGKVIVLEDDIVTSRGFLKYMNDALNLYENENKVMHISGFMYPNEKKLKETFFFNVPLCWGWATWSRAWKYLKTDSKFLYEYFDKNHKWKIFNSFGDKILQEQLEKNKDGKLNTWFIKWHGSVLIQEGLTLFPSRSLVENIGFDSSGIHCITTDSFRSELADYVKVKRQILKPSLKARRIIRKFYSEKPSLAKRLIKATFRLFSSRIKSKVRHIGYIIIKLFIPEIYILKQNINWTYQENHQINCFISQTAKIYSPYNLNNVSIGNYSYISCNSRISNTTIGKFCSIGPNLLSGWGIHPTNGISTSPMFYSTNKQNGFSLCDKNKTEERKKIIIGNDVFIGANVIILDGVTIGDGAVIGAGAVVSKDIPPYAIAVGIPIKILKFRFDEEAIERFLRIKWWNFKEDQLKDIEEMFFDVDKFLEKYDN